MSQTENMIEQPKSNKSNKSNKTYGSLTVTHITVPEEFNYIVKLNNYDTLLQELNTFWNWDSVYSFQGKMCCNPSTGYKNVDDVTFWVHNQHKNGFIYLYFTSIEEFVKLKTIIRNKKNENSAKITHPVFRYCLRAGWVLVDEYGTKNADKDIFGCDDYISQIEKDIKNHIKYITFLKELGEVRSRNYLLYGPPGTGKTSMIKAIASKLGCSVFIVNAGNVGINNISSILTPNVPVQCECKLKLLLFEDFDRFLITDKVDTIMSQILNSLDGFDDKGDTVRFFTANNQAAIFKVDALINRMSAKYEFGMPTRNVFKGKLERFLSFYERYDKEKAEHLLDLVMEKKITVRPFVNFVVRYLFDDNCLDIMIEKINELN